jgi:flagellin-like protein
MSTKNMLKSKKAISPILATLLLIVIAVAAIVVTYAWVMTYMSSATSQAGIMLHEDNPPLNWPSGKIVIIVRNTGTSDATIDAVYVGLSGNLTSIQPGNIAYNSTSKIVSKNGGTITITVTYPWSSKKTYYFRIAPLVGESLVFQETAP